jgi:hypothetical protein
MKRAVFVDMMGKGSIRFPDFTAEFATFFEALEHWQKLPAESRAHAVLVTANRQIFQPDEIEVIEFKQC